ncbi:MAG: TIR domain-containing protein [Steroidobacteraceae bacterium]
MPDIFLSYSREDQAIARRFADGLEHAGFSVWWDQVLHPGEAFDKVTEKALEEAKAVVVLWSKTSVNSRWVRAEATQAQADSRLVPVMIEVCKRPIMFELTHTADLSQWTGDAGEAGWQSFLASLRRFVGQDASGRHEPAARSAMPPATRATKPGASIVAIGLAAALLLGGAWLALTHRGTEPVATATAAVPVEPVRIFVLFEGEKPDQEYLADGLTEDIVELLGQIRGLQPLSAAIGFFYKGKNADQAEIAKARDVDFLLTGRMRNEGDRVFIRSELTARDGASLWSQPYEDMLSSEALRQNIAKDVALSVGVKLGVADYPRSQGGTENVAAYKQFQRARNIFRIDGVAPMLPFLREALRLDPDYKRASMSLYMALRSVLSNSPPNAAALRQEREDAATQLESMPRDSLLALRFRVYRMLEQRNWTEAFTAAEAGVALAPASEFEYLYAMAVTLRSAGRIEESISYLRRAIDAEPMHQELANVLQDVLRSVGREGEAQQEAVLAAARGVKSPSAEVQSWEDIKKNFPKRPDGSLEWPFEGSRPDVLEDVEEVRALLHRRLVEANGHSVRGGSMLRFVNLAGAVGDAELAITAMRATLKDTPEAYFNLFSNLWVWNLPRNSQSFKEFVLDFGLVEFWRKSGKWGDFCKEDKSAKDGFTCH